MPLITLKLNTINSDVLPDAMLNVYRGAGLLDFTQARIFWDSAPSPGAKMQ